MKKIQLILFTVILLVGCNQSNDDIVQQPNKDGAVEVSITTIHNTGYDVMSSQYNIWNKGHLDTAFTVVDTLKSLGTTTQEGEDENGNTQNVTVPKDYEFYITVK